MKDPNTKAQRELIRSIKHTLFAHRTPFSNRPRFVRLSYQDLEELRTMEFPVKNNVIFVYGFPAIGPDEVWS